MFIEERASGEQHTLPPPTYEASLSRTAGFTLIELIVVIVVLAIGGVTLSVALREATRHSADPVVVKQAITIAQAFLEEIIAKPFDSVAVSPSSWTVARTSANGFNDVLDYNGFTTSGIYKADGTNIASLSAYSVSVSVASGTIPTIPANAQMRVRVTVTGPSLIVGSTGQTTSISLDGYRMGY